MAPKLFNNQCKMYVVFQVKDGLRYWDSPKSKSTTSKNRNDKTPQICRKQFSYIDAYRAFNKQRCDLVGAAAEHLQSTGQIENLSLCTDFNC